MARLSEGEVEEIEFAPRSTVDIWEATMDKTQAKLFALSLLAPFTLIFQKNPKVSFIFQIVNELILTHWDDAWDTYIKKTGMKADALPPDDVDKLIQSLIDVAKGAAKP